MLFQYLRCLRAAAYFKLGACRYYDENREDARFSVWAPADAARRAFVVVVAATSPGVAKIIARCAA